MVFGQPNVLKLIVLVNLTVVAVAVSLISAYTNTGTVPWIFTLQSNVTSPVIVDGGLADITVFPILK